MTKYSKLFEKGLLMAALTALLFSCQVSNERQTPSPGPDKEEKEEETQITLAMRLPGVNSVGSRALTPADENEIRTVDVYVFDNTGVLVDIGYGRNISDQSTETQSLREFTVSLRIGDDRQLMVLANARQVINVQYPDGVPLDGTTTKESFGQALTLAVAAETGWNADPSSSGYKPIPMWGMKEHVDIDGTTTLTGSNGISVSRMLARVNVGLKSTITENHFKLTSVRLLNYNTKGRLIPAPDSGNWTAESPYASTPTLPADPGFSYGTPVEYLTPTTANRAFQELIYLFEAQKGVAPSVDLDEFMKNPCIVVGGCYDGSDRETFYRIDFLTQSQGTVNYLHILRNHSYNVTIQGIGGPGKETWEDAFRSVPENITADIIQWNDNDMEDVWFDGYYYYSVSPLENTLWAAASENNAVRVKTDYPQWSFELSDKPTPDAPDADPSVLDWLTLTTHQPGQVYPGVISGEDILYNVAKNETGAERTAYLHVTAGRVIMTATISNKAWYIDRAEVFPTGIIPSEGDTRTVRIYGFFEDTPVRAWDNTNGREIDNNTIPAGSGQGSAPLEIEELWMSGTRVIFFQYFSSETAQWEMIRTEDQTGLDVNFTTTLNPDTSVPVTGGSIDVTVNGNWPRLEVRAVYMGTTEVAAPRVTFDEGSGTSETKTLHFETNSQWVNRAIEIQWTIYGENDWRSIISGTQAGYDTEISTTHVAGSDIPRTGGNYRVKVTGTHPSIHVRAVIENTTSVVGNPVTVPAGLTTDESQVITIDEHPYWSTRNIRFEWSTDPDAPQWNALTRGAQVGYYLSNVTLTFPTTTSVAREAGNVTVRIDGDFTAVQVRTEAGGNTETSDLLTHTSTATVTVPYGPNSVWSSTTSSAPRDVVVSYLDPGNNTWINLQTLKQESYYLASGTVTNPTNLTIPRAGGSVSVRLTGYYPRVTIRAWVAGIGHDGDVLEGTNNTGTISGLPENETWASRQIALGYWNPGLRPDGDWVYLPNLTQPGYYITKGELTSGTTIPRAGGSATLKLTGDYPNVTIRAWAASEGYDGQVLKGTANSGTISGLPANNTISGTTSAVTRDIPISYWHAGVREFKQVATLKQPGYYISGGKLSGVSMSRTSGSGTITLEGDFVLSSPVSIAAFEGDTQRGTGTIAANSRAGTISNISANTTWSSRTLVFKYKNPTSNTWVTVGSGQSQPGYYITGGTVTSHSLAANAQGTATIKINGDYSNNDVTIQAITGSTVLKETTVPKGIDKSATLSGIPINNTWASRTIEFRYKHPSSGNWSRVGTATYSQAGFTYTRTDGIPSTIEGGGQGVTLTAVGTFGTGAIQYRAVNADNKSEILTPAVTVDANKRATLKIKNNGTGATRKVLFQYQRWNNGAWDGWKELSTSSQPNGNTVLSSGRILSKNFAPRTKSWSQAMGLPSGKYDNQSYPQHNTVNYTTDYAVANGGCAAYYEGSASDPVTGQGQWRLPRQSEMNQIPFYGTGGGYPHASCTEMSATTIYYTYRHSNGGNYNGSINKVPAGTGVSFIVRCVRSDN